LTCRPLTIPSITLPPSATDAFSAGKFTTKFEGSDSVDTAPKSDLLEEEEKYLEAFKVIFRVCRVILVNKTTCLICEGSVNAKTSNLVDRSVGFAFIYSCYYGQPAVMDSN